MCLEKVAKAAEGGYCRLDKRDVSMILTTDTACARSWSQRMLPAGKRCRIASFCDALSITFGDER